MRCPRSAWIGLLLLSGNAFAGELDWMAGHWCARDSEEIWLDETGGRALGMNRSRQGTPPAFEFMRVERAENGWNFIAQPGGRPPTVFAESARAEARLEFSQPGHDFPKRVRYWREGDALHARIDDGADQQAVDFRWTRCEAPAIAAGAAAAGG